MAWSLSERDRPEPEPLEGKLFEKDLDELGEWFGGTWYGKRFNEAQQRDRELDQQLIDQGGPYAQYLKIRNTPNPVEQKILKGISDVTNIDERVTTPATYIGLGAGIRGLSNVKFPRTYSKLTQKRILPKEDRRMINITKDVESIFSEPADIIRKARAIYRHHPDAGWRKAVEAAKQMPSSALHAPHYIPKSELAPFQKGEPLMTTTGGQGELFPGGPIDPAGKEAYRIFTESLARRSGYDTFKMMKKEIFDKWPQKDQDQAFRQLWQGTQTNYVGYSEHLTAKASKKLRRDKLVKKYPNETPAQIDVRLAEKSQSTFDMDWYWDKDWIDSNGVRRTDGLNRGDRNAPDNMQLLFNDRLKSMKDVLENIGYGSEERVGILWGDPDTNTFRDPDKRFLIKFETPQKRSVKKEYLRQNPGDAIIYRASNGKIIGNIGQYLDVLYPKKYKHPQTGEIINPELELMEKGVSDEINPTTGKLFTGVEEFREFIIQERLEIILRDTHTLPSNATARKRYIKERIDQDMVDLREKYPWLPKPPTVIKEVESTLTTEDYDLRTTSNKRKIINQMTSPVEKSKPIDYRQLFLDVFNLDIDNPLK